MNNLNIIKKKVLKKFDNDKSFFFLAYSSKGILNIDNDISHNNNFFYFLDKNLNIKIRKYKHKDETIFVYGNPIINEKINPGSQVLFEEVLNKKNYTKVNGSFIFFIFNNKKNELLIINDRFASCKLFYTYINNIFFHISACIF